MCRIYASTEPSRYESVTRSIRLHGLVTSVRLETEFWEILEAMAGEEGLTAPQFITRLHDEVLAERGEVRNLASLLRVVCAVYLSRRPAPSELEQPAARLASHDA